jgi:hypothetical protein
MFRQALVIFFYALLLYAKELDAYRRYSQDDLWDQFRQPLAFKVLRFPSRKSQQHDPDCKCIHKHDSQYYTPSILRGTL